MTAATRAFTFHDGTTIDRLGYGAMRLCGPGVWGEPADPDAARALLRRAVELGVDFVDTADAYGPFTNEAQIADALHPYDRGRGVTVATKGGLVRPESDRSWQSDARPEHLRSACEASLGRLRVECIDLYQLHAPDPRVPFEDSVGELARLRDEGKVRMVGLSNVSVDQLTQARAIVDVASVQNRFNWGDRKHAAVLRACEAAKIAFLPWYPIAAGELEGSELAAVADEIGASPFQVAIAWLLHLSPVVVPIPGTSSVAHLEENLAAGELELSDAQMDRLGRL